ncbi:hypothetical protein HPB52_009384 [Rhipicephalus sanguineus]|uniref:Sodium-dependent multivitamin transporter n=1 Tax=Rhipicephalus sanguineus TaxID=34632 RepID=A0A9D4PIZ9_RHISA|nr:hypothetical protein HPB52_009384 [Rhipicephalus sanguineus]
MGALEYILFAVLVLANFALGLYFSFYKHGRPEASNYAVWDVFLGSRTLMALPLAASTVASLLSSVGLVALPSHYYVYGWHVAWGSITPLLVLPLATHVFVPVIYGLDVTSIFQKGLRRPNKDRTIGVGCFDRLNGRVIPDRRR